MSSAFAFPPGAAYGYLEKIFGGPLREIELSTTVGVSEVEASPRDTERISLTFVNLGATTIFVRPHPQPSSIAGIRLGPSGGLVSMSVLEDGLLPTLEWHAIGDGAGGSLYVLGVKRDTSSK